MKKLLLAVVCTIMWFLVWFVLTGVSYIVIFMLDHAHTETLYTIAFNGFTLSMQFMIGWIPIALYINELKETNLV